MKDIINKIKYRFSIENISVNDCVFVFIICGYFLFFIFDAAFPFKNFPMSFLIFSIILFAVFLLSQLKKEIFENPLNELKKRKYEEKTKEAKNAYTRYLKKEQERIAREREMIRKRAEESGSWNKTNKKEENTKKEESKSNDKKGPFEDKKEQYKYYSDYGKYYDHKKKDETASEKRNAEFVFFKNCTNIDQVEKTYKKLCQIYHPDQFTGNNDMFLAIKEEYELAKNRFL